MDTGSNFLINNFTLEIDMNSATKKKMLIKKRILINGQREYILNILLIDSQSFYSKKKPCKHPDMIFLQFLLPRLHESNLKDGG